MQTLKPDDQIVKSLTALFVDAGNLFSLHRLDQARSIATIERRFATEGLGFVTKTLPKLGKHFDAALLSGRFSPIPGFKKLRKGALPCFLHGLAQSVFCDDGTLLDEPDVDVIRFIRQLCFMFYKLEGDYPEDLIDACIGDFYKVDKSISTHLDLCPQNAGIAEVAQGIVSTIFRDFDWGDIFPRPGPGSNATGLDRDYLYEPTVKYSRLHQRYPYYRYYYLGTKHLLDRVRKYRSLPVQTESVSRLALVPKDSRGPRVICMEPPEFMWIQQGLGRAMMEWIESHPLTKGQVNFTDQSINGELALLSSLTQEWATLDMKEASDRISRDLVSYLFDGVPGLRDALLSASTDYILTPKGAFRKKKYAPMGSALCFPVMSVVHYVLGLAAMSCETQRSPKALAKNLYVYGDDLVVKTEHVETILEAFPRYGLMFNRGKCCFTGHFRESCGVDAYKGQHVTPVRVKILSLSHKDGASILAYLAVFHGLFNRGLWQTAKVFQEQVLSCVGSLPCVTKHSATLGWVVPKALLLRANLGLWKWSKPLQSPCIRSRVITAEQTKANFGGWEHLVRANLHTTRGDAGTFVRRSQVRMAWKSVPASIM